VHVFTTIIGWSFKIVKLIKFLASIVHIWPMQGIKVKKGDAEVSIGSSWVDKVREIHVDNTGVKIILSQITSKTLSFRR
jgi:hypothetical protein